MKLFDESIVSTLKEFILNDNQFVDSILLGSYGLAIQFCDVKIHCNERVFAKIGGELYEWEDAPNSSPWGALGRQKVKDIELVSPNILRITFESDDYIEIETVEGQYESVVINFPSNEEQLLMDIY